jgi:hypothetical protein
VTSALRVYIRHVRAASLCARGTRAWFIRHNLSWVDFLLDGCDADVLIATGDPLALRAVDAARKEVENGRQ